MRYKKGGHYAHHNDYFLVQDTPEASENNRIATLLLYLDQPSKGGETIFPRASPGVIGHSDERFAFDIDFDACDVGLKTVAKPGDGILFFSQYPSLTLDVHSLHGGCPVEGGTKWGE